MREAASLSGAPEEPSSEPGSAFGSPQAKDAEAAVRPFGAAPAAGAAAAGQQRREVRPPASAFGAPEPRDVRPPQSVFTAAAKPQEAATRAGADLARQSPDPSPSAGARPLPDSFFQRRSVTEQESKQAAAAGTQQVKSYPLSGSVPAGATGQRPGAEAPASRGETVFMDESDEESPGSIPPPLPFAREKPVARGSPRTLASERKVRLTADSLAAVGLYIQKLSTASLQTLSRCKLLMFVRCMHQQTMLDATLYLILPASNAALLTVLHSVGQAAAETQQRQSPPPASASPAAAARADGPLRGAGPPGSPKQAVSGGVVAAAAAATASGATAASLNRPSPNAASLNRPSPNPAPGAGALQLFPAWAERVWFTHRQGQSASGLMSQAACWSRNVLGPTAHPSRGGLCSKARNQCQYQVPSDNY